MFLRGLFAARAVCWLLMCCAGCGGIGVSRRDALVSEKVRTRAARDLRCAPTELELHSLGGPSYQVRGCGKEATYSPLDTRYCRADAYEVTVVEQCQVTRVDATSPDTPR
jgi:hypothetical protein